MKKRGRKKTKVLKDKTIAQNTIKVDAEKECGYCSNSAKYVTTTNLGWEQSVCAFHLVQYGKQIDV